MKNADLKAALKAWMDKDEAYDDLVNKINLIYKEVVDWREEKAKMTQEINCLKADNRHLTQTLFVHQKYLERMEANKRANNVIMTGVSEDNLNDEDRVASSDQEKVKLILIKINIQGIEIDSVERLGKQNACISGLWIKDSACYCRHTHGNE